MSRRTNLLLAIAFLAVGLVGLGTLSTGWSPRADRPGPGMGMTGDVDALFIEQMIPHHEEAIAMADLAIERAQRPEIRELATDIKRVQSAEIEQMRTWYRERYGEDVPLPRFGPGMMGGMMVRSFDPSGLGRGGAFDRRFIEQMVPHHRMGIMMARMAGTTTRRVEIAALTESMIDTQSSEITEMLTWYEDWYGTGR